MTILTPLTWGGNEAGEVSVFTFFILEIPNHKSAKLNFYIQVYGGGAKSLAQLLIIFNEKLHYNDAM